MNNFKLFPFLISRMDKSILLQECDDKSYYDEYSSLFNKYPYFKDYNKISDPFSLIKSVIVLKGLVNKTTIEETSSLYMETNLALKMTYEAIHSRLPFFSKGKDRIYIPFFSEVCNRPYDKKLSSLFKQPFSLLKGDFSDEIKDPFFTYGYQIFDSLFSNLIKVGEDASKENAAFYSIDLETVFVISNQGTLEQMIPLFDKDLSDKRKDHLIPNLINTMKFYFDLNKEGFIDSLYNYHFISNKLYQEIVRKEAEKDD